MKRFCYGLAFLLLVVHLVWAAVRIPRSVFSKRLVEIHQFQEHGSLAFFHGKAPYQGLRDVEWLLAHSPDDCVVLWQGEYKGAFELLSCIARPRLFVHDTAVPADASMFLGRPLASGELADGRKGVYLLTANGESVELSIR